MRGKSIDLYCIMGQEDEHRLEILSYFNQRTNRDEIVVGIKRRYSICIPLNKAAISKLENWKRKFVMDHKFGALESIKALYFLNDETLFEKIIDNEAGYKAFVYNTPYYDLISRLTKNEQPRYPSRSVQVAKDWYFDILESEIKKFIEKSISITEELIRTRKIEITEELINHLTDQYINKPNELKKSRIHPNAIKASIPNEHEVTNTKAFIKWLNEELIKLNNPQNHEIPLYIHIDDIDTFAKVKNITLTDVSPYLNKGRIELHESYIKQSIESIIGEGFSKKDWGGESNDLYSTNIKVNGKRIPSAFLLKGKGKTKKVLQPSDCGKNGDQIQRLYESPADLLFIQYVGNISEAVRKEIDVRVNKSRNEGKTKTYCIIDGQDTARLLLAYDLLKIKKTPIVRKKSIKHEE